MIALNREALLHEADKLKLRGMRLRSFGDADEQWQATLLLRQAAKNELAALDLQMHPSDEEQARARIEACGLFLDAHDPVRAAQQWNLIPRLFFPPNAETSWLDKLGERFQEAVQDFGEHWRAIKPKPDVIPGVDQLSQSQIRSLVTRYQGVPEFWWALSKHSNHHGPLERVKELEPDFVQDHVASAAWKFLEAPFVRELSIKLHLKGTDMHRFSPISEEMAIRLELDEAREMLEYERSIEPADSKIPTIPSPLPMTLEEALETAPESARIFMLADVAPKVLQ